MANRFWVGGTNTWNATAGTKWATTSGGAGGAAAPTTADDVFFDANSGAGTVTIGASSCKSVSFAGFTGTVSGGSAMTVGGTGGFTWGATMAAQNYTGNITFTDTSGAANLITSNGQPFKGQLIFNGVGGVWAFADVFSTTSTVTLTNGTLSTGGFQATFGAFSSNNSNVRTFTMTGSHVFITGTGVVWQTATATNLTLNVAGSTVEFNSSAGTLKTLNFAGLTLGDIIVSGTGTGNYVSNSTNGFFGTWTISNTGGCDIKWHGACDMANLLFVGFNGSWSTDTTVLRVNGDLTLSAAMTVTNTETVQFNGTGADQTITSNGISAPIRILVDTTNDGTVRLADALDVRKIDVTAGIFDDNAQAITTQHVQIRVSSTVLFSTSPWVITGTDSGTDHPWAADSGALFVNRPDLRFTNAAATTKNFLGGAYFYGTITWAGAGAFLLRDDGNVFGEIVLQTQDSDLQIEAGTTQWVEDASGLSGTVGHLNSIKSDTPGTRARLYKISNFPGLHYLSLQDLALDGGAIWNVGKESVNNGNLSGARFVDEVVNRAA